MSKIIRLGIALMLLGSALVAASPVFAADAYPGVYVGDNCLVFVQASSDQDPAGLVGVTVLSYEYSMDWILTTARLGATSESGLLLTDGNQYVYNADGTRRSESEFNTMTLDLMLAGLEFTILPSYGRFLAPMVRGGLAYALVEMNSGLPTQIALARETYENGQTLNLYEGFLYQISDSKLAAQIAFTEIAFGSQGLVRGNFPENFPPPPEDQPIPYPEYPESSYPVPGGTADSSNSFVPSDPTMPQGREVSPEDQSDRPHFTLDPITNYDVRPIVRIGVVGTQSGAEVPGYGAVCDEILQEALKAIEGVEVVYIPYEPDIFGGAVAYDRAVWICGEYGVDALMMSNLLKLEIPGAGTSGHLSRTARVLLHFETTLIEGAGGSVWFQGDKEDDRMHDYYEVDQGQDTILRNDLRRAIEGLISDLQAAGKLAGGHVE